MRVVVDEIPENPEDCLFCKSHDRFGDGINYECMIGDYYHKHVVCCLERHGYCNCLVENKKKGKDYESNRSN